MVVGVAHIDPGQAVLVLEIVRDPLEVEVLGHQLPVAPHPAPDRTVRASMDLVSPKREWATCCSRWQPASPPPREPTPSTPTH